MVSGRRVGRLGDAMGVLVDFWLGGRSGGGSPARLLLAMVVLCAVAVPDIVWAGRTVYQYDELGRLKKVIHENGKVTDYGFDPAGNRTNQATFTGDAIGFSIDDPSVSEGGTLSFTVTKSGSTVMSHSVSYATANGTAVAGSDYGAKSGTLTFTSGQTSKGISVGTVEDTTHEPNETMFVNLSGATGGATIADSQGQGTITDDDPANQPPVARDDGTSVYNLGYVSIDVLRNDSDPDGDPLTITSVSPPSLGAAFITTNGRITYSATGGFRGTDSFTYTISDGRGGTDTATVPVSIIGGGPIPE